MRGREEKLSRKKQVSKRLSEQKIAQRMPVNSTEKKNWYYMHKRMAHI